jgi:hypothetical protein
LLAPGVGKDPMPTSAQEVLHVHVPHYCHMFEGIMAGPRPWRFGHVYLPGGSEALGTPAAAIQPLQSQSRCPKIQCAQQYLMVQLSRGLAVDPSMAHEYGAHHVSAASLCQALLSCGTLAQMSLDAGDNMAGLGSCCSASVCARTGSCDSDTACLTMLAPGHTVPTCPTFDYRPRQPSEDPFEDVGGGGGGGVSAPSVGVLMELVAAVRCPDGRLIVLAYGMGRLRVGLQL